MNEDDLKIDQIRTDYIKGALTVEEAGDDPVIFFEKWFLEAEHAQVTEVNAMSLATVDARQQPHNRIVLLKGIKNGCFQFFTNYNSAKGRQIAATSNIAAVFFWKELERQIRIEGAVQKASKEISQHYFDSRPLGSRISAIASPQSQHIPNREYLEGLYKNVEAEGKSKIVCPDHWGGLQIKPNYMEFWQGRKSRLHDRIAFQKINESDWEKFRLAP